MAILLSYSRFKKGTEKIKILSNIHSNLSLLIPTSDKYKLMVNITQQSTCLDLWTRLTKNKSVTGLISKTFSNNYKKSSL